MHLPRFEYRRADSLEHASRLLAEADGAAHLAAGGTDLFPRLKYRLVRPDLVVGLGGIQPEAPAVTDSGELVLDALTPLSDVAAAPAVRSRCRALADAAQSVGSNQVRHMGTLGGNLCLETRCLYYNQSHEFQFIEPCLKRGGSVCYYAPKADRCRAVFVADTPPVLMCLDAGVELVGPEDGTAQNDGRRAGREPDRRWVSVADLYTGDALRPVALDQNEIVARVVIPPATGDQGTAYAKFSLRGGVEFAGIAVAVLVEVEEDGATCRRARIAVGAVEGRPRRAREAESALEGDVLSDGVIEQVAAAIPAEVRPVSHHGYSGAYLRHCLRVQARDALATAWGRVTA